MADQEDFPDIYIDETLGTGTGVGSEADPYRDFSEINWTTGGDNSIYDYYNNTPTASVTINLKKDETWREQLDVLASGSATYPIIVQSYGSGDDPFIKGSTEVITWADQGGNVWKAPYATGDPVQVFFVETDDSITWGNEVANVGALAAEYDWVWDTDELYCYTAATGGDPDTRYGDVEATVREQCIYSSGKDYITVSDLETCFAIKYGVKNAYGTSFLIDSSTVHHIGAKNASQADGVIHINSTNCGVSNSVIHNIGTHGVFIYTEAGGSNTGTTVESNEVYDCHYSGIDIINANGTSSGHIIRYNKVYWTADYDASDGSVGIHCNGVSGSPVDDVDVYYNQVFDIPGNGIQLGGYTTNWNVYNNVACRRLAGASANNYGIFINGSGVSGHDLKNNISVDGATGCLYVGNSSMVSNCDYNLWYNTVTINNYVIVAAGDSGTWGINDYDAYYATTGWDEHGLWESPDFVDKANNDFHLQSSSPCRNVGTDVSLTQDYDGVSVPQETNPAIGAFEYIVGILSNYAESGLLAHIFKNTQYSQPSNIYVALCKSTIEDDDTGSTLPSEVSGGSYQRTLCNTWDTSGTQGHATNDLTLQFPTATNQWGILTDFAICDASIGGNMLLYGKLSESKHIHTGDIFIISTDDLDIALN